MRRSVLLLIGAVSLGLSGCGKKAPANLPVAPDQDLSSLPDSSASAGAGTQADFLAQMSGGNIIYFETDRFNIDSVDAAALQRQAVWLTRYSQKRAKIEGHADERGTREYNVALGERRANAAKNYLASLGVEASRLTVVSYGKERPVALGSDETSWAQNRRAVTVTID